MKRLISLATVVLTNACVGSAFAQLDLPHMEKAIGIASIIASAETCKYVINQEQLERYYVASGLSSPEGLSFVNANINTHMRRQADSPLTASQCTLARTTAKTVGVVSE